MRRSATMLVMLLGVLVLFAPTAATAQAQRPEYPIQRPAQVQSFGAQRPGESFTKNDCGFEPGQQATVRLNDTALPNRTVGANGCVTMTVRIVDEDTISIDNTNYDALRCRAN